MSDKPFSIGKINFGPYLPDSMGRFDPKLTAAAAITQACNCTGPKNGEPLCRCRMRNVQIKDGRYVEIIDHGPAPKATP